jgi:hypothetical protein
VLAGGEVQQRRIDGESTGPSPEPALAQTTLSVTTCWMEASSSIEQPLVSGWWRTVSRTKKIAPEG